MSVHPNCPDQIYENGATLREQCIIGTKRYLQALIAAGYLTAEIAA